MMTSIVNNTMETLLMNPNENVAYNYSTPSSRLVALDDGIGFV